MNDKTEDFIEEAEKIKEEAAEELEKAEKENNAILFRDACEKGWNAIIQATNALFIKKEPATCEKSLGRTQTPGRAGKRGSGNRELGAGGQIFCKRPSPSRARIL